MYSKAILLQNNSVIVRIGVYSLIIFSNHFIQVSNINLWLSKLLINDCLDISRRSAEMCDLRYMPYVIVYSKPIPSLFSTRLYYQTFFFSIFSNQHFKSYCKKMEIHVNFRID